MVDTSMSMEYGEAYIIYEWYINTIYHRKKVLAWYNGMVKMNVV